MDSEAAGVGPGLLNPERRTLRVPVQLRPLIPTARRVHGYRVTRMLFSSEPPDPIEEPNLDEDPNWQPVTLEDMVELDAMISAAEQLREVSPRIGPAPDAGAIRKTDVA